MTSTNINNILEGRPNRFSTLQKILKKNSLQKEWTKQISSLLDAPLDKEFTVIDIDEKKLTIYCHNSSAATQIKYFEPMLINKLKSLAIFSHIETIYITVGRS